MNAYRFDIPWEWRLVFDIRVLPRNLRQNGRSSFQHSRVWNRNIRRYLYADICYSWQQYRLIA